MEIYFLKFLTKIIFQNRYVALETGLDPPPFMANAILNFHFDFLNTSLIINTVGSEKFPRNAQNVSKIEKKGSFNQILQILVYDLFLPILLECNSKIIQYYFSSEYSIQELIQNFDFGCIQFNKIFIQ